MTRQSRHVCWIVTVHAFWGTWYETTHRTPRILNESLPRFTYMHNPFSTKHDTTQQVLSIDRDFAHEASKLSDKINISKWVAISFDPHARTFNTKHGSASANHTPQPTSRGFAPQASKLSNKLDIWATTNQGVQRTTYNHYCTPTLYNHT